MTTRRWALCASATSDLLDDLVLFAVGAGVALEPLEQQVALPGMGDVGLRLGLTITGGRFDLRADDGGRARVVVTALGDVSLRAAADDGDVVEGPPLGLPAPPAPIPVRVEALVDLHLELRDDRTVSLGLDLSRAELVSLGVDPDAPTPDGVDAGTWTGMTAMVDVMFSSMGGDLFADLGTHVGVIGTDLGPDVGLVLHELGVAHGPAEVEVGDGRLLVGLPARPDAGGRAEPVELTGRQLGVGVSSSGVDHLARTLIARAVGDLPLPFELEVDLGDAEVGTVLRQTRLVSDRFPDLRGALRTQVSTRLLDGRLELAVTAAWVELPPLLPGLGLVNELSRRVGGLAALAPLRFRFPAVVSLPVVPGSDEGLPVQVDALRVAADGVGIALSLA